MKKTAIIISFIITHLSFSVAQTGYPITPIPFTQVKVTPGRFWGQRLEASRNTTVPLAFSKCESEGRYKNFENAAAHLKDPSKVFKVNGVGFSFDDTDPYKTIEGAAYILQTYPDKKLEAYCDSVIDIIASAQEPDGYLYTARTQNPADPHHWAGDRRWVKEENLSHELYNLGHMVEGAVAYWQATGKRKFLDVACRYADVCLKEVGPNAGQMTVVPGHQIAEMAMARLYLATGEKKYLDFGKFLLDYRGKTNIKQEYSQSHKPVVSQDEAVGHAVRAAYMYAGMADVAALTGDKNYVKAIDNIWNNIVTKKLYITGGIGATSNGEAFGKNYELPNMSAYCETCAAIGNVYVNYRLFLLHGESKYYDVLERTLYNGLISGVSLEGNGFFYPNPLESMGQHQRQAWFGCACCPSNICRFIPSLPGYVYAVKDKNVYVNLFLSNSSTLKVGGKKVQLSQSTNYPWDGDITITIDKSTAGEFALKIRIPGWLKNQAVPSDLYRYTDNKRLGYTVTVNGNAVANSQLSTLRSAQRDAFLRKNSQLISAFGGPDASHPSFTPVQKAISYSMTSFFTTGGIRGGKGKKLDKFFPRSYNMGIRREVYQELGGFSKMRFGEDIDFSYRIVEAGYKTALIPEAWVWHKRRTDFRKFFRQVSNSGRARINLEKRHPGTMKLVHLLPTVFTLGVIGLLLCTTILLFLAPCLSLLALSPIILYSLIICIDSSILNKSLWVGVLSIPAAFVQLMGYGLGFIEQWWKRCILKQPETLPADLSEAERQALEKKFYK